MNQERQQPPPQSVADTLRQTLASIDVQRKSLELESQAIYSELTTPPPPTEEDEKGRPKVIPPMGVDTPLVDAEGYPRADIDVYRARTLRQRLRVLQTDYKALMKQSEELLIQLAALKNPTIAQNEKEELAARSAPKPKPVFDSATGKWVVKNWDGSVSGTTSKDRRKFDSISNPTDTTNSNGTTTTTLHPADPSTSQQSTAAAAVAGRAGTTQSQHDAHNILRMDLQQLQPFAKVNGVAIDSPAASAGLKQDDLIVQFGTIDHSNHNNLRALADYVPSVAANNQSISLAVHRKRPIALHAPGTLANNDDEQQQQDWEIVTLTLTPKPWSGRGLIGCHIVPHI